MSPIRAIPLSLLMFAAMPASTALAAVSEDAIAIDTVAMHVGVDRKAVEVVQKSALLWSESNPPCSSAIELSAQPIPGHRLLVRTAGSVYVVHVVGNQGFVCSQGVRLSSDPLQEPAMRETPKPGPTDPPSVALVEKGRDDLARRLSIASERITLIEFRAVIWPDTSYGCPRPGMAYTQVQRDGVLIRYEAEGSEYAYHGGEGRELFLCEQTARAPKS